MPAPALLVATQPSIACASATSCWLASASIGTISHPQHNVMLHWNGARWSSVAVPTASGPGARLSGYADLRSVSCSAVDDCSAVGSYTAVARAPYPRPQTVHWNGKHWSVVPAPAAVTGADNSLAAVSCVRGGACWTVGSGRMANGTGVRQIVARWNGKRWVG
jgi:hypothetical protein